MEGRLGRIFGKLNAPFRGQTVEVHYQTKRPFSTGFSYGQFGLEEGMEHVISDYQSKNGDLQKSAMIEGFAKRIVRNTPVPAHKDNPKAAREREEFIRRYVRTEIENREKFGSPAIKEAERILTTTRQTTIRTKKTTR